MTDSLRKEVAFREKGDILFSRERSDNLSRAALLSMTTKYNRAFEEEVEKKMMECYDTSNMWNEIGDGSTGSFNVCSQLFAEGTATKLKSRVLTV